MASLTTAALCSGSHSISVVYGGDTNYLATSSAVLTETILDFSLNPTEAAGASQSVVPGNSATYQVTITPTLGTNLPASAVLRITGLPEGATATLNTTPWTQLTATSWQVPATTTLNNVSLTFNVPRLTAKTSGNSVPTVAWGLLLFPFAYSVHRSQKKRIGSVATLFFVIAGLAVIGSLSGCASGNGFFGNPQQTYTMTVTVTAGSVSHATDLTLTVQ
jgi:hypothetical protein